MSEPNTNAAATEGDGGVTEAKDSSRDYSQQIVALVHPQIIGASHTTGATKAPQITIVSEVLTGEYKGKLVRWTGLLNPENQDQLDRAKQSVEICCSGSIDDVDASGRPKGFGTKKVQAIMGWEEVPATAKRAAYMQLRAIFLNDAAGGRNSLNDQELGSLFKSLKSGAITAPKEGEIKDGKLGVKGAGGKPMEF